jgi:serine/threonine protein kinase
MSQAHDQGSGQTGSAPDIQFLKATPILDTLSDQALKQLMVAIQPVRCGEGERLMHQGEEGDCFYIIRQGSCAVSIDKDGEAMQVAVLRAGDLVGEMAILTGESRNANVDAVTDMALWRINRKALENISLQHPEIRQVLTQVVTKRFATARFTSDRTVGKYVINEIIGRGGWSIVYKGIHKTLNMPVAIKMLKHDKAMDATFLAGFQQEATTIANLNHENIVKIYDIERMYRTVFIIMEYLQGASLENLLRTGIGLPVDRAVSILIPICNGLHFAHCTGITHGDIKPANISILPDSKVKIVDFGLARPSGTRIRQLMGTPKYMAPEQISSGWLDERSDIYSMGIMAFRMITGREPYQSEDQTELLRMHLSGSVPDPRSLVPELPEELARFVIRATRRTPESRYQTAADAIQELRPLVKRLGLAVPPVSAPMSHMKGLFVFYRAEQQDTVDRLLKDFSDELQKLGTVLHHTDFKG